MYRISVDVDAEHEIAALPTEALPWLAELLDVLELTPWNGDPYNARNPDGNMRTLRFGPTSRGSKSARPGVAVYVVHEDELLVRLVRVSWRSPAP